jgi:hypothetical protein
MTRHDHRALGSYAASRVRAGDGLPPPWEGGITGPPWCELCTWAARAGVMTVKFVNRSCLIHGHLTRRGSNTAAGS